MMSSYSLLGPLHSHPLRARMNHCRQSKSKSRRCGHLVHKPFHTRRPHMKTKRSRSRKPVARISTGSLQWISTSRSISALGSICDATKHFTLYISCSKAICTSETGKNPARLNMRATHRVTMSAYMSVARTISLERDDLLQGPVLVQSY